jgi:hypothetical protein
MSAPVGRAGRAARPTPEPGLCGQCRFGRRIESRTGSTFLLCERARDDPDFPRYPRLPVIACRGFTVRGSHGESE